ncbi:hypothetical protein [Nocardioides zeicaulis]|uniref:Integral membrane protein n=1 Tax=Nocardioides zeicaulis TaxID=1776857 RepID=A0ABV6E487_9ACTN
MGQGEGRVAGSRAVGAAALAAALVSAGVTVAGGLPLAARPEAGGSLFGPAQVVLVAALALLGAVLLVRGRDGRMLPVVAVAGLAAAELAGVGVVSVRRWGIFVGGGYAGVPTVGWQQGRVLAAAMGLVCATVALVCLGVLVRHRARPHRGRAALAVTAGAAVALLGPLAVRTPVLDRSDLAAWALMYAVPFAAALALVAWVPRRVGLALAVAVAASAVVAPLGESFLEAVVPSGPALPVVLLAAGAVGACLVVEGVRDRDGRRDLATPPGT